MKKTFLLSTFVVAVGLSGSLTQASPIVGPVSCTYNEFSGTPTFLYQHVESGPNGWYSPYKAIQFCDAADGSSYVIIEEELIHGFNVFNIPRAILSATRGTEGTTYTIAKDVDDVVLRVSPDGKTLDVSAVRFQENVQDHLALTWHQ